MLEKTYGKDQAENILQEARSAVRSQYVETWQYRPDLSFTPQGYAFQAPAREQQKASTDTLLQFLLTSAAADFHAQHPAHTILFRNAASRVSQPGRRNSVHVVWSVSAGTGKRPGGWNAFRDPRHRVMNNG